MEGRIRQFKKLEASMKLTLGTAKSSLDHTKHIISTKLESERQGKRE